MYLQACLAYLPTSRALHAALLCAGWVTKKVNELLGEELSFCAFIMEQLAAHSSAAAMLAALRDVLDEDSESFTTKLWQILIYEQLKLEHGSV